MLSRANPKHAETISRLENWKFSTAHVHACKSQSDIEQDDFAIIHNLSTLFGNSGWFDGEMAVLVSRVVETLVPPDIAPG